MAHYDVQQLIENIEGYLEGENGTTPEGRRPAKATELTRSLRRKLEGQQIRKMREFHAIDRPPVDAPVGFFKKLALRFLRIISARQAAYNWSNMEALQAMAYEIDMLRERLAAVEMGPARPLGMARLAGADTTRLANLVQQHLQGFHEHADHMTRNMTELNGALTRMLDNLASLSSRLNALSLNQRDSATEVAAARLDISRLWTELGLVYESLDTRAEDLWKGLDERDQQMTLNTEAAQSLHGQVSALETQSKELRARMVVVAEQLALQQEMLENMQTDLGQAGTAPPSSSSSDRIPRMRAGGDPPAGSAKDAGSRAEPVPTQGLETGSSGSASLVYKQLDMAYMRFQRQFRGDEDELRGRQKEYLQLIDKELCEAEKDPAAKHLRLLDIACGDGIFLELARAHGWTCEGVDINEPMIRQARARDLTVHQQDALAFLDQAEGKTYDVISAFQFIEHLTPFQLMTLLKGAYKALRPGGLILLETINPHTLKAMHWYHLDLSHERLIFPEMLSLLAETAGFKDAEWHGINPVSEDERLKVAGSELEKENLKKLNDLLFGDQDYYLIARKSGKVK